MILLMGRENHGEEEESCEEEVGKEGEKESYTKVDANRPTKEMTAVKLSDYKKDYYEFSGKASDVARMAAFAGIALIWVFKVDVESVPRLPRPLVLPAGLFALALALDLLQYIAASVIWGIFHRYHERKLSSPNDDPDMSHPSCLAYPCAFLFLSKLICVMCGYIAVALYIGRIWLNE